MADINIKVYGANWCPDCKRAKKFLGEQRIRYDWIDLEREPQAQRYVEEVNNGKVIIPTILFGDGSILVEPSNAELAEKLGIQTKAKSDFYDFIVVGGGPAGLTAAMYAAREGIETLVVERSGLGGQASVTERIDNFPGFPDGIRGEEFADRIVTQARRFEVELLGAQGVSGIKTENGHKLVTTDSGDEYCCAAVLLSCGSTDRKLEVPREEDFIGAGVHFCATCDGPFYKGQEMVVVGGGNSAVEEGIFLTKFAPKVTVLERGRQLRASKLLQDKAYSHPKMAIRLNTVVKEFRGDTRMRSLVVTNTETREDEELTPGAVFVFIGLQPNTQFVQGFVELDQWGYIVTGRSLETTVPGVYAAGDVRAGSTKQIASSVGEGAAAALMVRDYLKER